MMYDDVTERKPFRKWCKIKTFLSMQPVARKRYNINQTEKRKPSRITSVEREYERENKMKILSP